MQGKSNVGKQCKKTIRLIIALSILKIALFQVKGSDIKFDKVLLKTDFKTFELAESKFQTFLQNVFL